MSTRTKKSKVSLPSSQAEKISFVRGVFKQSLFVFAKECLGYDKLYDPHEEWCRQAEKFFLDYHKRRPGYSKRAMRLMPRGTFKSTILTVAFALWMLIHDPNLRILIYSGSEGLAKNFLREIKKQITMNGRFRTCFGKWNEGSDHWTETSVIIGPRTKPRKEPSFAAIGRGSEITSMHFDIALVDDLVTREDRESASGREMSKAALRDLEAIMEPESLVQLVGTHWHFDDAYAWLLKELNPQLVAQGKAPWETQVETVYEPDGKTERFARILTDLEDLKIKRGLVDYYANYMNNPLPPDTQLFSEDTLTLFDYDADLYRPLRKYAYWDPASTKQQKGKDPDYHGILIIANNGGHYDVVDVWMKQDKPSVGYKQAVDLARGYDLEEIRVETNHLPDGADNLEEKIRKAGLRTAVSGEKHTTSKQVRIESLEPLTTAGRIRFRRDWRECSQNYRLFMEQLTMYPVASHDDGPDALEGCYQLAAKGNSGPPVEVSVTEDQQETTFINSIFERYT